MPKEETIELRHIKNVIGELNNLPLGNARSSIISRLSTIINRILGLPYQMHLNGRSGINKINSLGVFPGGYNIIDMAIDGTYLYALSNGVAGVIIRIKLTNFLDFDTLPITAVAPSRMIIDGGADGENYLYAIGYDDPSILSKVRLSDFTEVGTITLTTSSGYSIATNGTYLLISHSTRYVTRVLIDTFLEVSVLDLGAGVGSLWATMCSGTYAYILEQISPGRIWKIDTNTFIVSASLVFPAGFNNPTSMIPNGNHIYVGFKTTPGRIIKVNERTFAATESIVFGVGLDQVNALACDPTSIYCALDTTPGLIAKVNIASFAYIDNILLTGDQPWSLCFDETFLYSGFYASRGVERIYLLPEATVDTQRIALINSNVKTLVDAPPAGYATAANQTSILADIGDASASTLRSIYGIIGNPAAGQDLATRIGYQGVTSLADKLTVIRAGYIDELAAANIPADVDTLKQRSVTTTSMISFKSLLSPTITLSSISADVNLLNIIISNVPANTVPVNVFVNVRVRALNNTNVGANAINVASAVRIKKSTGAWGVDDIVAITIPDNALSCAASTKEGGLPLLSSINVSSEVDGNATYNLRFEDIKVDGDNLELIDVIAEIEYYYIPT